MIHRGRGDISLINRNTSLNRDPACTFPLGWPVNGYSKRKELVTAQ